MRITVPPLIVALFTALSASSAGVELDVVYPRSSVAGKIPVIQRVDSTFVFGSIHPTDCFLVINGAVAAIYPNGAFIAFAPVNREDMVFEFVSCPDGEALLRMPFAFPEPEEIEEIDYPMPVTLKVAHPHSVMRYGSVLGVYYLFPAQGAVCYSERTARNYFGTRLNGEVYAWIEERFTEPQIISAPPAKKLIYSLDVRDDSAGARILIPSRNSPLHRVEELTSPARLKLTVYNVESHIDIIRNSSRLIREIRWEQESPDAMALTIFPAGPRIWGYYAEIDESGDFIFHLVRPPELEFKGLRVALDPGHGGHDLGAIGPTRLTEKEVNLSTAKAAAERLRKKGAQVLLTRNDDSFVDLYERMELARAWGADIFISIHNNALPDGKNPAFHRGLGVYYYHPRTLELAQALHRRLLEKTRQPDNGLYYDNLAVPRTTYMPSVLVETAYIIHPEEEMLLRDERFRTNIAEGIYLGIKDFIRFAREEEKKSESWR